MLALPMTLTDTLTTPNNPSFPVAFYRATLCYVSVCHVSEFYKKGLNIGLRKQRCTIAQGIYDAKDVREIRMGA